MVAACHVLVTEERPDLSLLLPEVHVALAELGLLPRPEGRGAAAWENSVRWLPAEGDVAQAALTLRAFDAMCASSLTARVGRLEADDVVTVLRGVTGAMRNWTWEAQARTKRSSIVRWDVQNEYHVQNLLWTILSPLFADLRAEEYVAAVGHKNPRIDLGIPSLRLVVEVKFVRLGVSFAKIIEEIAADASLYGTDGRWESLIPFVWDDSRRVEDHPTLIEGLRRLPMVHDAVAVSRPGRMDV